MEREPTSELDESGGRDGSDSSKVRFPSRSIVTLEAQGVRHVIEY